MTEELKAAFAIEMQLARRAESAGDLARAFHHLERAHILGQRELWPHLVTHWVMLRVGAKRRDGREVFGQVTRLFATFLGWATGWVPIGNTGGADVSPLRPMPLPPEFVPLLAFYSTRRQVVPLSLALLFAGVGTMAIVTL
jgi:hypothetical protein